ncbi:hypothetical protein DSM106972_098530 [Dulcicalothrix desertica PCC 7102]|uniref:JAB domain-containing protein n=1 Tax=Dulcicalothrix desertica PCC 7102 TaxID=232991 RepID=A0A433UFW7_9CYAN|nr:Mov34/MPN/PAD-1 family protein [Dulcicalothrix desertica]RUS92679.1 hypothetical protein DSM106972_098530 [Dulcicalothrix desertica PCC 7102]TWH61376.1 26S proteasome regulatory subunit N11 [Dulcicalothrix desertica PCC 7102]
MSKLKWRDSEDVYQPISRHLQDFLNEKEASFELNIGCSYATLSNKPMNIFIVEEAEDELKKHLTIDPNNETGGVLVGQAYFCPETKSHYTEILGSIAAPYTVGNRVHFKFTPECWQEILKIQKQTFPNTTIVGWYHSHPGHGIFLSGTDLNTQRLSFKQVWQIATVYDPIQHKIGYFYGENGRRIENSCLIYIKDKSSVLPENIESETNINLQPEQLSNSNAQVIQEQGNRNRSQPVLYEQRSLSPDAEEEDEILSDLDNFFLNIRKLVQLFISVFKITP